MFVMQIKKRILSVLQPIMPDREELTEIKPEISLPSMPSNKAAESESLNFGNAEIEKKPEEEDFENLLSSVRISVASRALGLFWFILTYLFAPEPPNLLIPVILFIGIICWSGWEFYWQQRWKGQEKQAVDLMNSFGDCLAARNHLKDLDPSHRDNPLSLLPSSYHKQAMDVLKAIQHLASDVAMHTTHTPLR